MPHTSSTSQRNSPTGGGPCCGGVDALLAAEAAAAAAASEAASVISIASSPPPPPPLLQWPFCGCCCSCGCGGLHKHAFPNVSDGPDEPCSKSASRYSAKWPPEPIAKWSRDENIKKELLPDQRSTRTASEGGGSSPAAQANTHGACEQTKELCEEKKALLVHSGRTHLIAAAGPSAAQSKTKRSHRRRKSSAE